MRGPVGGGTELRHAVATYLSEHGLAVGHGPDGAGFVAAVAATLEPRLRGA